MRGGLHLELVVLLAPRREVLDLRGWGRVAVSPGMTVARDTTAASPGRRSTAFHSRHGDSPRLSHGAVDGDPYEHATAVSATVVGSRTTSTRHAATGRGDSGVEMWSRTRS